jgi:NAD(P)-dependent dehydrogenase (short-subunit alcohol dehydrogenase family)
VEGTGTCGASSVSALGSSDAVSDELDFNGKVVLVTGGTRGIGAGITAAFLERGATVVACGRNLPEHLADGVSFVQADVRDPGQAAAAVDQTVALHGRIDIVVNNAGGTAPAPAATLEPERAAAVVTLNLLSPFYVAQRANSVMQGQESGGQVINIGSVAELRPAPGVAIYAAAKSGLTGLTRALALEWAPKVRVNQVTPGLVETEGSARHYGGDAGFAAASATIPQGRFARPSDVASACVLLASPLAGHISGADLRVDGGGEVPGWLVALRAATE